MGSTYPQPERRKAFSFYGLHFDDRILQGADTVDGDLNDVLGLQGEVVRRHDPGPGKQNGPTRKSLAAEKITDQFIKAPFDLTDSSIALEDNLAGPLNAQMNFPSAGCRFVAAEGDPGANRTRAVVDFCLRE